MEPIIEVKNVSMIFKLPSERVTTLKEFFVKTLQGKLKAKRFVALDDLNISINRGEVVGFIGHNGAGKSTLLKVISRIIKPSKGIVSVRGSIVPMLELGSGFDFELTGRENIFLNGAILGYSKDFLESKFNEIVEFSELEEFLDMPLRNYSSGMVVRLAFAIATIIKPEILVVDEILAVGDFEFQKKSRLKMQELMSSGTTVLFVSHEIEQIKALCNKVVWLERGRIKKIGDTDLICKEYSGI